MKWIEVLVAHAVTTYSAEVKRLNAEVSGLRSALSAAYAQYRAFGVFSPETILRIQNVLGTDFSFQKSLDNFAAQRRLVDTVPREDYEALRISHEKQTEMIACLQTTITRYLRTNIEGQDPVEGVENDKP